MCRKRKAETETPAVVVKKTKVEEAKQQKLRVRETVTGRFSNQNFSKMLLLAYQCIQYTEVAASLICDRIKISP